MNDQKKLSEMMDTMDALEETQVLINRVLDYKNLLSSLPSEQLSDRQQLWLLAFQSSEANFSLETEEGQKRMITSLVTLDQERVELLKKEEVKPSRIRRVIKNTLIFIALLVVATFIISQIRGYYSDDFENLLIGIALSSLVVFVWGRISKKYLA